jgi:hypothetical protein
MNASLPIPRGAHFKDGQTAIGLLGIGLTSLLALGFTVMDSSVSQGVLNALLGPQALMMALAAAMSTSSAAVWTARWQGRVAPSRGEVQVRQSLWQQLVISACLGLCGPLALAFHAEVAATYSLSGMPQALLSVLALLMAAQALGGWCGIAWRGRASRWVLLGWIVLALAVTQLRPLRELLQAWPGLSLLALLLLAQSWWTLRQRLAQSGQRWGGVSMAGAARPAFRPAQFWQRLPFDAGDAEGRGGRLAEDSGWNQAGRVLFYMLFNMVANHRIWEYQAWEGRVQGVGMAAYAGWMALVTGVAGYALIHPAVHWRRRLAPGAGSPLQWAWRMWLRSLAVGVLWLTLLVGIAAFGAHSREPWARLGTWPTALGDVCLAYALAAWMRARRNTPLGLLVAVALMFGVILTLAAAAAGLGHPLVRGGSWLTVELFLAALLGVAAVRRWAGRNITAPP